MFSTSITIPTGGDMSHLTTVKTLISLKVNVETLNIPRITISHKFRVRTEV